MKGNYTEGDSKTLHVAEQIGKIWAIDLKGNKPSDSSPICRPAVAPGPNRAVHHDQHASGTRWAVTLPR